jgi:hypothetical protein
VGLTVRKVGSEDSWQVCLFLLVPVYEYVTPRYLSEIWGFDGGENDDCGLGKLCCLASLGSSSSTNTMETVCYSETLATTSKLHDVISRTPTCYRSLSDDKLTLVLCEMSLNKFGSQSVQTTEGSQSNPLKAASPIQSVTPLHSHIITFHEQVINSTEHSPSKEADSRSASQEIPRFLSNQKFITVFTRPRHRYLH